MTATLASRPPEQDRTRATADIWRVIETAFADPRRETVEIPLSELLAAGLTPRDLRCACLADGHAVVERSGFYQSAGLWITHPSALPLSTSLVPGPNGRDHPQRPPAPEGEVYSRFDPVAQVTVSFRAVEIERDLDMFHRWQNDPRVAFFWEENKPRDELRQFLQERHDDPHVFSVIGCFDGEPAGYFETYWAREDRLGAHYDAAPWDRGWHGLIGEAAHLGRRKTAAWLRALTHYLFLDCPMTGKVVGEPRADHVKLLRYADEVAYRKIKEFDFPHKRAALMHCHRAEFFARVRL